MKYILLFLLINVLCLALQPALNLIISGEIPQYCFESCHAEEKHGCESHAHDDTTDHHDEENGCVHSCNPLLSCGCCYVIPVYSLFLNFNSFQQFSDENISFKEKYTKSVSGDFWHPPQLV